jgi:hypothetical protein
LLDFAEGSVSDSDDDDEEEDEEEVGEDDDDDGAGPAVDTARSHDGEEDEEDDDDDDEESAAADVQPSGKAISTALIRRWKDDLQKDDGGKRSMHALRHAVVAFSTAAHFGDADPDDAPVRSRR